MRPDSHRWIAYAVAAVCVLVSWDSERLAATIVRGVGVTSFLAADWLSYRQRKRPGERMSFWAWRGLIIAATLTAAFVGAWVIELVRERLGEGIMRRAVLRALLAVGLLVVGYSAGRAQSAAPDFALNIDAPSGWTRIQCERGCFLQGGRDLGNGQKPTVQYSYQCNGDRCRAIVNGWLSR